MQTDSDSAELLGRSRPRPSMAPKDLRAFIGALDAGNHLRHMREATDWRSQVGALSRASHSPLLFENIKDYPGSLIFTNGLCDNRLIALALGIETTIHHVDLTREVRRRVANPIKPTIVADGPVRDHVVAGEALNLFTLPVPQWSAQDGGRYIGTWHINVTRDPESGIRNVGVYRMQLLGPRQATVSASIGGHFARHVAKAECEGKALPMSVAIGVNEAVLIAAAAASPEGMDEYELAGAFLQEPVELLQSQNVCPEVPAHSEIVIEGEIEPNIRVQDGPYFDYTGRMNTNPQAYLFNASRIMFRNQPIFRGTAVGAAGAEDHQLFAFLSQLGLVDFHGSRVKRKAQNFLLRHSFFRPFQIVGSLGSLVRLQSRGPRSTT